MFRIRGIQLAVHFTFFILLAYVAWEGWRVGAAPRWLEAVKQVGFLLLTFVCVVLHEFGHAFMGRRFGVNVPRILLLPIGGMAQFDAIPREPRKEIAIALAGPAVNFVLVALLLCFVPFPNLRELFSETALIEVPFAVALAQALIAVNLIMGCLNLVPVFPMDGGRVFRALLARRLSYLRATFWAAAVGKVLAVAAMWVTGYHFENPLGACLFAFIFLAGEVEYRTVFRQEREAERARKLAALRSETASPFPTDPVA